MKQKACSGVLCLLSAVLFLSGAAWGEGHSARPEMVLQLEPSRPQAFQPTSHHNRATRLVLQLRDADTGRPVPGPMEWELEMTHVKGWGLLSTGFPHVEGKQQLKGTFPVEDGRLELKYLFPVRGRYHLMVRCRASALESTGSRGAIERSWTISVAEQPENVRNAGLFLTALLLFGVGVGLVFARSATAKAKGSGLQYSS